MPHRSDSESESEDEEEDTFRVYPGRLGELIGRVVCAELEDRKKTGQVPALVVSPNATDLDLKRDHIIVKSFKDNRL